MHKRISTSTLELKMKIRSLQSCQWVILQSVQKMKTLKFLASSHPDMGVSNLETLTVTATATAAAIKEGYNLICFIEFLAYTKINNISREIFIKPS